MAQETGGEGGSIDASGNFVPAAGANFFVTLISIIAFLAVMGAIIFGFFGGILWLKGQFT